MRVYHVTTIKKFSKYLQHRCILPPVRAWLSLEEAERFSLQTCRSLILPLNINDFRPLEGHKNKAIITDSIVRL